MPWSALLIGLVAALHLFFLALEMFLWDTPFGRRVFGLTRDQAAQTKVLAMNQGLYNGFLAAGLIWSLTLGPDGKSISVFFLACVFAAGVFGALTVNRRILLVQALPALLGLLTLLPVS